MEFSQENRVWKFLGEDGNAQDDSSANQQDNEPFQFEPSDELQKSYNSDSNQSR